LSMLRNGVARVLLGLGIILISLASKIDPDFVQNTLFTLRGEMSEL